MIKKILIVGDGHSLIHEVAVSEGFKKLGYKVDTFYWHKYFSSTKQISSLFLKIQNRYLIGPVIMQLNYDLMRKAYALKPDLIFIYRGTHIMPSILRSIRSDLPGCKIVGYNNDDPFSKDHPQDLWRHFMKSIAVYDVVFAYRQHNIEDFRRAGAQRVELLRSWYIPEIHKKIETNDTDLAAYRGDCVFIGHFESDGRAECIEELVKNGIEVKIFGPYKGLGKSGWDSPVSKSNWLKKLLPITYLDTSNYVKALSSIPIALCFLSKLNKDTYTRRCFEIPAVGAALFSEYSQDLDSMFKDGEEAVYFKNKHELTEKVRFFIENKELLDSIRKRGHEKVIRDNHDIYSRLRKVIEILERK